MIPDWLNSQQDFLRNGIQHVWWQNLPTPQTRSQVGATPAPPTERTTHGEPTLLVSDSWAMAGKNGTVFFNNWPPSFFFFFFFYIFFLFISHINYKDIDNDEDI